MSKQRARTRGNGEGSIYRRSSDGRWIFAFYDIEERKRADILGITPKLKYITGKTRNEVVKRKREYDDEAQLRSNGEIIPVLFKDWTETWLELYKAGQVRSTTYKQYVSRINAHMVPELGESFVHLISPSMLQALINSKKNSSQSIITTIVTLLSEIFDKAEANHHCTSNPVKHVVVPRGIAPASGRSYNLEQEHKIIAFSYHHPYGLMIHTMLRTGVRAGELLGLQPQDLDFANSLIYIKRQMNRQGEITPPKTAAGIRAIPFDKELKQRLAHYPLDAPYVFQSTTGRPFLYSNWYQSYFTLFMDDLQKEHPEIPVFTPKDLRSTFATLSNQRGVPVDVIQYMMGHTDRSLTINTYTAVDLDYNKQVFFERF